MDVDQSVAGMDGIAFVGVELNDAARKFTRDAYGCSLDLPFDIFVGTVHEQESDNGYDSDGCHDDAHRRQQCAVGAFLLRVILLHVYRVFKSL